MPFVRKRVRVGKTLDEPVHPVLLFLGALWFFVIALAGLMLIHVPNVWELH